MKFTFTVSVILIVSQVFAQEKTRLPIWTFNTQNTTVYGVAFGYTTTSKIDNVKTNGLRFEALGVGIFLPLIPGLPLEKNDSLHARALKGPYAEIINGINLSPIGAFCDCKVNGLNLYGAGSITGQVNGISTGIFMNITERQNGIQLAGYFNFTYESNGIQVAAISNRNSGVTRGIQISAYNETRDLKGLQIGIYNKASKVKGVQLGIWNVNDKRKRPFVNF